jgi:ATP-dependent Lon protease
VPVRWIDRVLELALERAPQSLPEEEAKAAPVAAEQQKDTPASGEVVKH